jgi:hypothetical protein
MFQCHRQAVEKRRRVRLERETLLGSSFGVGKRPQSDLNEVQGVVVDRIGLNLDRAFDPALRRFERA